MKSTREQLLQQNFRAMHLNGFQGLRTDKVLAELQITKGAFYHYFPDKMSLGYALVDEVIKPQYLSLWKKVEEHPGDSKDGLVELINYLQQQIVTTDEVARLGCPLNNLIQEMSPLDEGFRNRLQFIVAEQRRMLVNAFRSAQKSGIINSNEAPEALAFFFLASVEGAFSMAKAMQQKKVFDQCMDQLKNWVKSI